MSDEKVHGVTTALEDVPTTEVAEVKVITGNADFNALIIEDPPQAWTKNAFILYACCLLAFFCSTMNGYDGSLMGNMVVLKPFQATFGAGIVGPKIAYIQAMYQIGGVVALPFVGPALDTWGRRPGMFIGCFIIVVGTIIQGTTSKTGSLGQYLGGRFLLGFGISIAASAGPAYVVEVAHPAYRGVVTGLYNCFWFSGSILAAGALRGSVGLVGNNEWLIPTWLQMFFPALVCLFCFLLPESPRWLYTNGHVDQAKAMIAKYHANNNADSPYVHFQIREFEEAMNLGDNADKRFWDYSALFRSRASCYRLMCNVTLSIFGQWAGNSVTSYYLPALLSTAGITDPTQVLNINLGLALISAAAAIFGASQADRVGRRPLLLFTNISISFIWVAITVSSAVYKENGAHGAAQATIAFVYLFGIFYSVGFTPLQALYPVEVLSYEMRAKGMAFSSLAVNAAGLLNQFAWPNALAKIGWKTYIIFTLWCCFQATFIYFFLVETKGRTLEELDEIFSAKNPRKASTQKKKVALDASHNIVKIDDA